MQLPGRASGTCECWCAAQLEALQARLAIAETSHAVIRAALASVVAQLRGTDSLLELRRFQDAIAMALRAETDCDRPHCNRGRTPKL